MNTSGAYTNTMHTGRIPYHFLRSHLPLSTIMHFYPYPRPCSQLTCSSTAAALRQRSADPQRWWSTAEPWTVNLQCNMQRYVHHQPTPPVHQVRYLLPVWDLESTLLIYLACTEYIYLSCYVDRFSASQLSGYAGWMGSLQLGIFLFFSSSIVCLLDKKERKMKLRT